ncbi:MAG: DUF799 family lipoprotein [Treponema sp.]|uniref:GNA1162 family protein n=1 Tax=Treponema sp. TaxID=166 RepID=UPI00298EBCF9|nr:GNA1162 family protein [Treponema sp.]MBR5933545.1 DUF799 family lipoprotein [Treponema sp.]
MKKFITHISAVLLTFLVMSCTSLTKEVAFPKMYEEKPVIFLIMPPINNSNNADAKDYFYTTLNVPMAEAGYYVLPPVMTMETLQRESAYDSERFVNGDLKKFRQMFGADVAVFTVIKDWRKAPIGAKIIIEIDYIFRSTKTNEIIYRRDGKIVCDTSTGFNSSGSLLGSLVKLTADAVKTAVTDYWSIAVSCNQVALSDMPYGKYHPQYGADGKMTAMPTKVDMTSSK